MGFFGKKKPAQTSSDIPGGKSDSTEKSKILGLFGAKKVTPNSSQAPTIVPGSEPKTANPEWFTDMQPTQHSVHIPVVIPNATFKPVAPTWPSAEQAAPASFTIPTVSSPRPSPPPGILTPPSPPTPIGVTVAALEVPKDGLNDGTGPTLKNSPRELRLQLQLGDVCVECRDFPFTLGRNPSCNFVVNNPKTSNFHAVLHRQPDGSIYLQDTRSRNGTYWNGDRLAPEQSVRLEDGDRIQLGPSEVLLTVHIVLK